MTTIASEMKRLGIESVTKSYQLVAGANLNRSRISEIRRTDRRFDYPTFEVVSVSGDVYRVEVERYRSYENTWVWRVYKNGCELEGKSIPVNIAAFAQSVWKMVSQVYLTGSCGAYHLYLVTYRKARNGETSSMYHINTSRQATVDAFTDSYPRSELLSVDEIWRNMPKLYRVRVGDVFVTSVGFDGDTVTHAELDTSMVHGRYLTFAIDTANLVAEYIGGTVEEFATA